MGAAAWGGMKVTGADQKIGFLGRAGLIVGAAVAGHLLQDQVSGGKKSKKDKKGKKDKKDKKCFRKSLDHKKEFSHPGDLDWPSASMPLQDIQPESDPATDIPTAAHESDAVEDRGLLG